MPLVLFLFWLVGFSTSLWMAWRLLSFIRRQKMPFEEKDQLKPCPPISVLKPLKGLDPDLEKNLTSFFKQSYPHFEILFSVADRLDPALEVVERLRRSFPNVPSRVFIGEKLIGANPKLNNLSKAYEQATYDHVLISDSNVIVEEDYLFRLSRCLDPRVGLVTALVAGARSANFGAHIEEAHLNSFFSRAILMSHEWGHPCVIGKSMLFQRSVAERFGGLRALSAYLAEDYAASLAFRGLGLDVRLCRDLIVQNLGSQSLSAFWKRHIRWGRMRKVTAPLAFVSEPLWSPVATGLAGAVAISIWTGIPASLLFSVHLSIWFAADFWVAKKMNPQYSFRFPIYWLVKELFVIPLWFGILLGNKVEWRGRWLRLERGGLVSESSPDLPMISD